MGPESLVRPSEFPLNGGYCSCNIQVRGHGPCFLASWKDELPDSCAKVLVRFLNAGFLEGIFRLKVLHHRLRVVGDDKHVIDVT